MPAIARQEIVRRIVERTDLERFTDRILGTFWDLPEFQRLRPPRDEVRAWVRWNLELVTRWLVEGRPPSESELEVFREHARARAAEGVPADTVPSNFRRGARFAWRALMDAASEEERLALVESADLLFEYVDRVSGIYFEAYQERADATGSAEEARAQAVLRRIAADEASQPEDRHLAARIGFALDRSARPFVIVSPRHDATGHAALAALLRRRGMLAVSEGRRVVGLVNSEPAWSELELDPRAAFAHGPPTVGVERAHALHELCDAIDVAVARGASGPISPDDYIAELLLRRSPRLAGQIVQRIYGPLNPQLAHTLDVLVEHNFERAQSAATLPVHRNTLRDRIHRISETIGVDIDSTYGRGLAWLAWLHQRGHRV